MAERQRTTQAWTVLIATLLVAAVASMGKKTRKPEMRQHGKYISRIDTQEDDEEVAKRPSKEVRTRWGVCLVDMLLKKSVTMMHELGISMARLSALPRREAVDTGNLLSSEEYDKKTDLFHEGRNQGGKLVVIMVGLPGRGKSYMARKVARYLNWINYATRVFNIGNYRRKLLGADHHAEFFDPDNPEGKQQRMEMAEAAMEDMLNYLNHEGEVAIYDGTNSTLERRLWIQEKLAVSDGYRLLFIESVCEDERIIERNIIDTKLRSPDYKSSTPEEAVADFRRRIAMYRKNYEALGDGDEIFSYVKVIDAGTKLIMNRIHGYLPMKILSFVSNLHIVPRPIYMTVHGESDNDIAGRLGGDAHLTARGVHYSQYVIGLSFISLVLGKFISETVSSDLVLWYSTAKCARETVKFVSSETRVQWRALRGLEAGLYSTLTRDEFEANHSKRLICCGLSREYRLRQDNPLWYRYPLGESFVDVISRLEPVIYEIERSRTPVVIVASPDVVRCLYAYFLDLPMLDIPTVPAPLHEVIELHTTAYECLETRHALLLSRASHGHKRSQHPRRLSTTVEEKTDK
ncbi:Aste57867_9254 [Aphanomyces stellatus]|uniref:Aste57867_9254 protein n=1 Tax=Aphanomyces stellatus TaxID=120398 RepID=A0A485KME3_9STRA|nr:hypothetical protein As57867_009218 [Aphanomyces stellatus]VFT86137.1 Aste57867_9254 [Aphanomyces stellatus]